MTADEEALIAAVIAAPDDDTPKLVYADWLEEHGRPAHAAVFRGRHHRAGGNPAGRLSLAKYYPDLCDQFVYLAGATAAVLSSVPRGIIFLMAWWSGQAHLAFGQLAGVLRDEDPAGRLMVVVIDVDGIPDEFYELFRPYSVPPAGAGEAAWVCRGSVARVSRHGTQAVQLRAYVRELLSADCARNG